MILIGQVLLAQEQYTWYDIDTIETHNNRTLVEYKTFSDSILIQKAEAYFYPTVREIPRFRILQNLFRTEVKADSIVFHGNRTTYLDNQFCRIEKYELGKLLSATYFDSTRQEITKSEFNKYDNARGPCGEITGHFFYHGKNTKKKN